MTEELRQSGIDVSSSQSQLLFHVGKAGETTGLITVIVCGKEHTRTCIFTPGTAGELVADDFSPVDFDDVFKDAVHLHSDSRHTDAALVLAREARKRAIPVSVDVERDRRSDAFDALLDEATLIFTNSNQMLIQEEGGYLDRRIREFEETSHLQPLPTAVIVNLVKENGDSSATFSDADALMYAKSIRPIFHSTRRYRHSRSEKEVVVTKGNRGAMHIACTGFDVQDDDYGGPAINEIRVSADESGLIKIQHVFTEEPAILHHASGATPPSPRKLCSAELTIRRSGVLASVTVADTTGAGDAFIGGYIVARVDETMDVESCLRLGSFVAGRKLEGAGARTSLPTGADVDTILGKSPPLIQGKLRQVVGPFLPAE